MGNWWSSEDKPSPPAPSSIVLVETSSDSEDDTTQTIFFASHNAMNGWFRVSVEHLPQASVESSVVRMARGDGTIEEDGGGGKANLPDDSPKSNGEEGAAAHNTANNTANSHLPLRLRRGFSLKLVMPTPIPSPFPSPSPPTSPMVTPMSRLPSPDGAASRAVRTVSQHLLGGVPMERTRASRGRPRVEIDHREDHKL
ncbi:hypothetical protein CspeluHIS016_0803100 [Cutaneotrichosporon spelunceum]|uniref:Uncharacterized protein n=1 Tax=Cutaneotrichosporon spelunceum TaxID=1672016 RepID=A0AAD3U013_9TREE|nr:hypothetical protein CspeluHIS016_0803100 [Cutaneotrichosporon spelunceum]